MVQKIFADLHNHTTASDGDFIPEQLVKRAKALGIKAIGITDHDTLEGLKNAVLAGEKYKIEVIPGVEVSIRFKRSFFTGTLHLLCYFKSARLLDDKFVKDFQNVLAQGRGGNLSRARVDEINKNFGPAGKTALLKRDLAFEDISAFSNNATRRHFALALKEFFGIMDMDIINTIIGNNSPAYLPSGIKLEEIIHFIRDNHILAVLAHPAAGSFTGKGHYKEVLPSLEIVKQILPEFIAAGIQGLEVYYPGHIKEHQELMKSWAEKYNLLLTGGSDCHDGIERPVGVSGISESEYIIFKESLA
ncbi:MAG: PHP domain-containing protein [Deltaproteobacteria bacterium]|uniref:PHP domain-containing protein n=1 Tax=Desulfobacula sp. TaxID=2593537 RepID=UPI0019C715C0|nr:PHP domain-containing protein [Candidatus Desulfobacula maris]MBL6993875.1 PHP domain-containing protein [Desulfobacula sp.]